MKNYSKNTKGEDFKLLPYLTADLRRARMLIYGVSDEANILRLWLGIVSPRFIPVLLCRLASFFYCLKLMPIAKAFSLFNFFFFGIEIAVKCHIGKGLFFPHTQGTVIGAYYIGENAIIYQGVTLGARELEFCYLKSSRPVVGDNVTIGSGAKILGGLNIGSGSRIGANAVVLESIPSNTVAVGIPARIARHLI